MIRYDYVSAYKRWSVGDQKVVRALLWNQALNLQVVFLCHDEAESIDYVTVFYLICVLHRGVKINTTFDQEIEFCLVNLGSEFL